MPPADESLIDKLAHLERANDLAGALQLLASHTLPPQTLATIAFSLYRRDVSGLAFLIARQLLDAGFENWMLDALSSLLGLRLGQQDAAETSIARLGQLLAHAGNVEREKARAFLDPHLPCDVVAAFHRGERERLRAYARLWAAIDPDVTRRLASPPPQCRSDPARFLQPADDERLLRFEAPPDGTARSVRKAVLAIRRYWVPEQSASREHDIPVRIAAAMDAYGWQPIRCHLRSFVQRDAVIEDYRAIDAHCREFDIDLLILDEFQPRRGGNTAPGEIVRALKRDRPELRVVGLYLDPWVPEHWGEIEAAASMLDAVWSPVVTALWQRPAFQGKTLFIPLPHGGGYPAPDRLQPGLCFRGGVQYSNWDRAFWLDAISEAGLKLRVSVSTHARDDLDPLESYRAYMRETSATEATLNFSRRSNGEHTLTARTFEVPAAGGLLVQQQSPDVDLFFVAGRHYLRFETLADLADIAHLVRTEPNRAEDIRREGAAFFRERYADDRIIAYLDHFLFHRQRGERDVV